MLRLFLLLGFLSLTAGAAQAAVNCACNGRDPFDSTDTKNCRRYQPVKADKTPFGRLVCDPPQLSVSQGLEEVQDVVDSLSPTKSYDQVLDYISCYRIAKRGFTTGDEQFCHFKKTLAPYIKLAAESGKMSPTLMACLTNAESDFAPLASSGVAYGYPQFTPGTLDTIGNVLDIPLPTLKLRLAEEQEAADSLQAQLDEINTKLEDYTAQTQPLFLLAKEQQSEVTRLTRELKKNPSLKGELAQAKAALAKTKSEIKAAKQPVMGKLIMQERIEAELRAQKEVVRAKVAKVKAAEVWASYWEGSKPIPQTIDLKSVKCPRIAFAVSAVKQVYDLFGLFDQEDIKQTEKGGYYISTLKLEPELAEPAASLQRELETGVYLAGAYNVGAYGFEDRCDPEKGLAHCLNFRKRVLPLETTRHMNAVNNCAKSGSTKPMRWDFQKKAEPDNKDCEASKCST